MAPRQTRNSAAKALQEPPATPLPASAKGKGKATEKVAKEWPKTPRFMEGPVPLNMAQPPTEGLRGAFQYKCICEPKKAFTLGHFYECGVQKWDRQLISHIQHCVEDALYWYAEKRVIQGDERIPFQIPDRWPVPFMKDHQALAGTSNIPDETLHKWVRSQEKVHFEGAPTFYSTMMRINLLAPREPTLEPTHLLARVPVPPTKHVWNELGWVPVVWYVVKAIMCTIPEFDLFNQGAVPYSKYLNGAMTLAPVEDLEAEGYPIVGGPPTGPLYRWSDRVILMFLEEDEGSIDGDPPVIPHADHPSRKPFLDGLVEKYRAEKALLETAREGAVLTPPESEEVEEEETLIELSSDEEDFHRPALAIPPKKKARKSKS